MIASQARLDRISRTDRLVPDSAASEWTPIEPFAFRFVFAYSTTFFCGSLLDSGSALRRLLSALSGPPVR